MHVIHAQAIGAVSGDGLGASVAIGGLRGQCIEVDRRAAIIIAPVEITASSVAGSGPFGSSGDAKG